MIDWNKYFEYRDSNLYWKDISEMDEFSNYVKGRFKTGKLVGYLDSSGYMRFGVTVNKIEYTGRVHRIIWEMSNGPISEKLEIDHINGIRSDNRIENLRLATRSQNEMNKGKQRNNKSGFKGVSFHKKTGKWLARIGLNGKSIYLGYFDTKCLAAVAYAKASIRYHGKFSKINLFR